MKRTLLDFEMLDMKHTLLISGNLIVLQMTSVYFALSLKDGCSISLQCVSLM